MSVVYLHHWEVIVKLIWMYLLVYVGSRLMKYWIVNSSMGTVISCSVSSFYSTTIICAYVQPI